MDEVETEELINDEKEPVINSESKLALRNMMEVGLFYGLSKSRTNPKTKPYIASTKSGIEIIDLRKMLESVKKASEFLKEKIKNGGLPLLVGTTPSVKKTVNELGKKLSVPYVTERWLGGTLTNFKSISARIEELKKLKQDKESGNLDKYTKKERLLIDKRMEKLDKFFSGLQTMNKLPDVVVIFDLKNHEIVARETKKLGIKSIAVLNTNADPELVSYPVVANDRNPKSIEFLATFIEKAIEEGKKEAQKITIEKADKEKEKEKGND